MQTSVFYLQGTKNQDKARWHKDSLQAAGLPAEYSHDTKLGTQHPKAALLRNCLSDNVWTLIRAYHAGQRDTDACPFFNASKGTARHINWTCPASDAARHADPRVREHLPDPGILPGALAAHGWAPAMHADPTQPFWGDALTRGSKPDIGIAGVMSIHQLETGFYGQEVQRDKHPQVAAIARAQGIPDDTAERFFIETLGTPTDAEFDIMPRIGEKAPKIINAYTDGSTNYHTHRFAAIGTYAAYHICEPDRPPITEDEKQSAIARDSDSNSIELYSSFRGAFPLSNRTEAAGVLLSLLRPGPIHIGVGNANAVGQLNTILHGHRNKFSKPWALLQRGDIWQQVGIIVGQRGRDPIRVTKVKGQTCQTHRQRRQRHRRPPRHHGIRPLPRPRQPIGRPLLAQGRALRGIRADRPTHHSQGAWSLVRQEKSHGHCAPPRNLLCTCKEYGKGQSI